MIPTSARRRRLLLNLLLRPLLILWVQSDLALVHCPSINRNNLEGETDKQTNKQAEVACAGAWMQGVVWSCIACGVQYTMHQSMQKSFGDALEMHWKSAEFNMQGCTLTTSKTHYVLVAIFSSTVHCKHNKHNIFGQLCYNTAKV